MNRPEFDARLQALLDERRRHSPASLLFIDLDRFKAVNDLAGHAAGDSWLKAIARILVRRVREGDTVARLGGDELAVLLRDCERGKARVVAEQIRQQVAGFRLDGQGRQLDVGASIGVVEIDEGLGTWPPSWPPPTPPATPPSVRAAMPFAATSPLARLFIESMIEIPPVRPECCCRYSHKRD